MGVQLTASLPIARPRAPSQACTAAATLLGEPRHRAAASPDPERARGLRWQAGSPAGQRVAFWDSPRAKTQEKP